MDANLKTKWVEALRSDKYEQCQKEIGWDNYLCCIGVAGAVAGCEQRGAGWGTYEVADKVGLTPAARETLIKMNDFQDKSFAEIADWIETNL